MLTFTGPMSDFSKPGSVAEVLLPNRSPAQASGSGRRRFVLQITLHR